MAVAILAPPPKPKVGKKIAYMYPYFGPGEAVLFWAENGLIRCEDRRPKTPRDRRCKTVSWQDMAERVLVWSQSIITDDRLWRHERVRAQAFVCDMEEVLKEAKHQGGPIERLGLSAPRRLTRPVVQNGDYDLARRQAGSKVFLPLGSCDF